MGVRAEQSFRATFPFREQPVSLNDQRLRHIDIRFHDKSRVFGFNKEVVTVEIKAAKRVRRHDHKCDYKNITLELLGITGKPGWIYSQADIIAFEIAVGWWLTVTPWSLQQFVLTHTGNTNNPNNFVETPHNAINGRVYRRKGRLDAITRVPAKEIFDSTDAWLFDSSGSRGTWAEYMAAQN